MATAHCACAVVTVSISRSALLPAARASGWMPIYAAPRAPMRRSRSTSRRSVRIPKPPQPLTAAPPMASSPMPINTGRTSPTPLAPAANRARTGARRWPRPKRYSQSMAAPTRKCRNNARLKCRARATTSPKAKQPRPPARLRLQPPSLPISSPQRTG